MEWVETTGKTIEEARDRALDRLGVAEDEAEIEVVEEPKAGLFGLIRGEARIRARVRPAEVRPKQDRRRSRRNERSRGGNGGDESGPEDASGNGDGPEPSTSDDETATSSDQERSSGSRRRRGAANAPSESRSSRRESSTENNGADEVDPAAVGAAAKTFVEGLVEAFGLDAEVELLSDGVDLEVHVRGEEVGLLIGPGGRTLTAIQDLTRVAAQRRLGDHETRLRVDVAGYRERRRVALERFAQQVAEQVLDSGTARSLEPMPSADRKVIHDVIAELEGVTSRSEGDDPERRVVVLPT